MSAPGLGDPQKWRRSYEHPRGAREAHCEVPTTGRSRHLADDGRHFTDPAARFAGIFVGIVNAAPVVIFSVAQQIVLQNWRAVARMARTSSRDRGGRLP